MVDVAPAPALPTLPHSLVHEVCHYLWPADVARLADTCRSLGVREEEEEADLGGPGVTSALIKHGLRFFRPSYSLPADTTMDLIRYRLPRLQGLRVMDLSGAELPYEALSELSWLAAERGAFKSVRVLSFYDNGMRHVGTLATALEDKCFRNTLEGLYIRANPILEDPAASGGGRLLQALADGACLAPLRALCLAQTGLGDLAAGHLGRTLASPHLKHLKKLDLHNNELTGEGAKAIATGLVEGGGMPCLDELYLGFNRLGDDGARAMAPALRSMPALRELDMASNEIGDEGVLALTAGGLQRAPGDPEGLTLALETLDLRNNRIADAGATGLLEGLTVDADDNAGPRPLLCPRLASIFLDDNRCVRSAKGKAALQELQAATGIAWAYADIW